MVGGGPAGSIAALTLARAGAAVTVLEAGHYPRDKVCGDALIPDSQTLLDSVGLLDEVRAAAHALEAVRVTAPGGATVRIEAPVLTLRRSRLDELLARVAERSGATLLEGASIAEPVRDSRGFVVGVAGSLNGSPFRLEAPVTILATGAASKVLSAFGVCERTSPSALALRGYFRVPELDERELIISYERPVMPGYGWVFPMGSGLANVGVGVFLVDGRPPDNLKHLFHRFTRECDHIRSLMARSEPVGELAGAPLRCAFEGCRPVADGLLVAGEAIGTTYSLSGEGIGKAMESGRLAAEAALAAVSCSRFDARTLGSYVDAMTQARLPERFAQYRNAQRWVRHSFVVDLLARSAARSARVRSLLQGILTEELAPSEVLSARGLLRLLLP